MPLVTAEHIYKSYKTSGQFEINRLFQSLARTLKQATAPHTGREFVLKDVNFTVDSHESVGLIGNNGAGKTTLFRLLSSITLPTKGRLRVEGRVSSLISLGAGFHPDLSGRENLYLNCALMGLSRAQTADRIDGIVDFAELDEYIDMPIKYYSSVMLALLGFSVSVHLDPALILIDEVLSVGDYQFQVKSAAALRDFIERGTVILVSHDLGAIERICKRTIWLERGEIKLDGPTEMVIPRYLDAQNQILEVNSGINNQLIMKDPRISDVINVSRQALDANIDVLKVEVRTAAGEVSREFCMDDTIVVVADLVFKQPISDARIMVGLIDIEYQAVVMAGDNQLLDSPAAFLGHVRVECRFPHVMMRPRRYGVYVIVSNMKAMMPLYIYRDGDARFLITGERHDPSIHYYAPQVDLVYNPAVEMHYLEVNTPL